MHVGRVLLVLLLGAALLAAPAAQAQTFFDAGRAEAGLDKIFDAAGHPAKILGLDIRSNQLAVEVQAVDNPNHVDSWTAWINNRGLWRYLKPESLTGPRPVELNLINRDLDADLFSVKPADLAPVAALAAAAIKRAALEDPATVNRMELRRHLYLLPEAHSGDVEWTVEVTSGRERATIYASLRGDITHANFDGTLRAQRVNYLAGGKELDVAIAEVADVLGKAPTIKRLIVYPRYLSFEALNPEHPERDSGYSAGINGVYRHLDDTIVNIGVHFDGPPARFAITDVDWPLLLKLEEAARQRLELPGGKVGLVIVSKPNSGPRGPEVQWEINIKSATDTVVEGTVTFDNAGNIVSTRYPPGRAPKRDMLDAAAVEPTFAALSKALGEHAAVFELVFSTNNVTVSTKDPQKPDDFVNFEYAGESVARSIMPVLPWPTFGPDWFFDLSQLKPVTAHWAEWQQHTLKRLGLAGGRIDRVTINKQRLFMPDNNRVLVEIRAEEGKREGRVVYDLAGKVVDIVTP